MRGAAMLVSVVVFGCATAGAPGTAAAPAANAQPAKAPPRHELVVIGKGPQPMPGMRPQDEGTDFIMYHNTMYRCTRGKGPGSSLSPDTNKNCRAVQGAEGRDPDPGRVTRASVYQ